MILLDNAISRLGAGALLGRKGAIILSIFNSIPAAEVAQHFTHRGWLGFCPVWVNERSWAVTERNWVPEWVMWLNLLAQDCALFCIDAMGGVPPSALRW